MPEDARSNDPKDRISRALGAAFLGHQVEQLETRVFKGSGVRGGRGRGQRGRTWNPADPVERSGSGRGRSHKPPASPTRKADDPVRRRSFSLHPDPSIVPIVAEREKPAMADVIVLDASVLVHALGQMKRWCKTERKEIIIVPLEALNTLDLLKKGGTTIAIHARAASRFLEAQVGTNPRIRVQRDEDFVPWDEIYSAAITSAEAPSLPAPNGVDSSNVTVVVPPEDHAPEWMRQIVCCAEWETRRAKVEAVVPGSSPGPAKPNKVALAVIKPSTGPGAVLDIHDPAILTHIPRTTGDLMRLWGPILGLKLLNVDPGTSDRSDHRPDKHRTSASDGNIPSHRKGGRGPSQDVRGLVEKVKNGVPGNSVVAPGGAGKIRLLTRGEKLDP